MLQFPKIQTLNRKKALTTPKTIITTLTITPTPLSLTRKTTEARSNATAEWIRSHTGRIRRYRTPKGSKMRKALSRTRKGLAGRFYQLLSGHAATAEHLSRVGQAQSDLCWWCGSGERQSRHHLFVRCQRWGPEIRRLWQRVRLDYGWGGAPSVRRLFGDERAVPAILEFLEGARVGEMPGQILMTGGLQLYKFLPTHYQHRRKPLTACLRSLLACIAALDILLLKVDSMSVGHCSFTPAG